MHFIRANPFFNPFTQPRGFLLKEACGLVQTKHAIPSGHWVMGPQPFPYSELAVAFLRHVEDRGTEDGRVLEDVLHLGMAMATNRETSSLHLLKSPEKGIGAGVGVGVGLGWGSVGLSCPIMIDSI